MGKAPIPKSLTRDCKRNPMMQWNVGQPMKDQSTHDAIAKLLKTQPLASFAELGRLTNCSREYVRQISEEDEVKAARQSAKEALLKQLTTTR